MPTTLWRVFPWSVAAAAGAPFSPQFFPQQSGQGRFDLPPNAEASAWYFAESPEHAIGEKIQHLRNRRLYDRLLLQHERRLAICSVQVSDGLRLADLCDARELLERDIAPDHLAYRDRSVPQRIATDLHRDPGLGGLRWWSSLFGEWHTVVLFSDRVPRNTLTFGLPAALQLDTPALVSAAAALAIEIDTRRP